MADSDMGKWDRADIILKPVGGLLTALAVAGIGIYGSHTLNQLQTRETSSRTYAQLVSQREAADSSLRKDMFSSIVNTFLNPDSERKRESSLSERIDQRILNLEMLAYNFHDALDLAPLFKHVRRQVDDGSTAGEGFAPDERDLYMKRLEKIAKEISGKEVAALSKPWTIATGSIDFECYRWTLEEDGQDPPPGCEPVFLEQAIILRTALTLEQTNSKRRPRFARKFEVEALDVDEGGKEVRLRLRVSEPAEVDEVDLSQLEGARNEFDNSFWVDFFDFPMIDNTRLTNNERCALVLSDFGTGAALVSLVYFPASRASLKDKPFYDEVIDDLLQAREAGQ